MLHDLAILDWVIGFALATVLAISIAIYQNYKKYVEQLQRYNVRCHIDYNKLKRLKNKKETMLTFSQR